MDNLTNESILKKLQKSLNSNKIVVERSGKFPSSTNKNQQYATIIVKSNDRPDSLELVEDFLKRNQIKFVEKKLPGSSFNGIEIVSYLRLSDKDTAIRILFKFRNGKDFATKVGSIWNDLLIKSFSIDRSLARIPSERSEVEVIKRLNSEIQRLGEGKPVDIKIKSKLFKNVAGFVGGVGTKKADFVIVAFDNSNNPKEIGFISYKLGTDAKSFQQYGGISDRAGNGISKHQEVESFKDLVIDNWDTYSTDYNTLWRPIEDRELKKMAVFGPDCKKSSGYDSVDFIAQGTPRIKKVGATRDKRSILKLDFNKVVNKNNITSLQSAYEPTLTARKGESSRRITNSTTRKYKEGLRGGIFTRDYANRNKSKEI